MCWSSTACLEAGKIVQNEAEHCWDANRLEDQEDKGNDVHELVACAVAVDGSIVDVERLSSATVMLFGSARRTA